MNRLDESVEVGPDGRTWITYRRKGYDCLNAPCQHEVKGDHGIHCDEWIYVVLDRAKNCALTLTVFTDKFPETVRTLPDVLNKIWGADLTLHVPPYLLGRLEPEMKDCAWVSGGCVCDWSSSLAADGFWTRHGADARMEQGSAFWQQLDALFNSLLSQTLSDSPRLLS